MPSHRASVDLKVTVEDENRIIGAIDDCISRLRDQIEDDTLEEILRSEPGRYSLRSDFTRDRLDPERTTKNIWRRAARLHCYGEAFEEVRDRLDGIEPATAPRERERLQANLDAAVFHAYGLDREQPEFVLDDFHGVRDPRRMTDEYFDLVLEKYGELSGGVS